MKEQKIPSKEKLREIRPKHLWKFAQRYKGEVQRIFESNNSMNNAQMYALDLCAEHLNLPISELEEVAFDHLDQFQSFLARGCDEVVYALVQAENYFIEQFLAEPDKDDERYAIRWLERRIINRIRGNLGRNETDLVDIVDIAIYLFELELSSGWKSSEMTNKFGHKIRVVGRKEAREQLEEARSLVL